MNLPLPVVQIPRPCNESWSGMEGDALQRTCASCDHTVHRLDALTPSAQRSLMQRAGREKICVAVLASAMTVMTGTGCSEDATAEAPVPEPQILLEEVILDEQILMGEAMPAIIPAEPTEAEPEPEPPLMIMGRMHTPPPVDDSD